MQAVTYCAFACHTVARNTVPVNDENGFMMMLDASYYDKGVTGGVSGDSLVFRYDAGAEILRDFNGNFIAYAAMPSGDGNGFSMPLYRDYGSYAARVNPFWTWNGRWADQFWLSQNFGKLHPSYGYSSIRLRIDDLQSAIQQLVSTARTEEASNKLLDPSQKYSMQFFMMNYHLDPYTSGMTDVKDISTSSLTPKTGTFAPYKRDFGHAPTTLYDTGWGYYTQNGDTDVNTTLSQLAALLPTPGSGASGAAPQQTVLIVTDGMAHPPTLTYGTEWTSDILSVCTAIKNHGAQIAILYTEYDPATASPGDISTTTPKILPALRTCASSSSLVFTVKADGNISAALSALFKKTIPTAPRIIR